MIIMVPITIDKSYVDGSIEKATDLFLAFLNKINIGGFCSLSVGNSEDPFIKEKFEKTIIFRKFLEHPKEDTDDNDETMTFKGAFGHLCDYLGYWCCSPCELSSVVVGATNILDEYIDMIECSGENNMLFDLNLESVTKDNIGNKFVCFVKFHV